MADFEVLRFDQSDVRSLPSQSTSESGSLPVTPSLSLESSPPSTPTPPPSPSAPEQPEEVGQEAQATSSSPQLRLMRRKAPEVHDHIDAAAQLLPDSNCPQGRRFTHPFTNWNCCGAKGIIVTQHVCNCGKTGSECALRKMNHVAALVGLLKWQNAPHHPNLMHFPTCAWVQIQMWHLVQWDASSRLNW